MGGGEVARYLSRHGGARVAKAVLISSVTPFLLKTDDHLDGVDGSVFRGMIDGPRKDRPAFLANFAKTFFGAGVFHAPVSTETTTWTGNLAMLASPKATTDCVTAFGTTDFRDDMAHVTVPTLVIHGDGDQTVPIAVAGKAAAAAIPGAVFLAYEGAPHAVPFTDAERLNGDLLAFLKA